MWKIIYIILYVCNCDVFTYYNFSNYKKKYMHNKHKKHYKETQLKYTNSARYRNFFTAHFTRRFSVTFPTSRWNFPTFSSTNSHTNICSIEKHQYGLNSGPTNGLH